MSRLSSSKPIVYVFMTFHCGLNILYSILINFALVTINSLLESSVRLLEV